MLLPQSAAFRRRLLRWYAKHARDLPWRRTRDPYAILVSEMMLQQTQVSTVIPYFHRWLNRFPDFSSLAAASQTEVLHAWQGLGYYSRARNLHAAAKAVVSQHDGMLPGNAEALRKLPGIGRYTANAVAIFAYDQPLPIVEANITRVIARLFDIRIPVDSAAGRKLLWEAAISLMPPTNAARFNSALIDLGAVVCRGTPECKLCPAHSFCQAKGPGSLPIKKPRPVLKRLTECHALTIRRGRILLEQCTQRWRGMWMLPACEQNSENAIFSSVFPFTNHQITLRVFRDPLRVPNGRRSACPTTANRIRGSAAVVGQPLRLSGFPSQDQGPIRWTPIRDLSTIPIPSPHRRAINACLSLDVGR